MALKSINPFNGELIKSYSEDTYPQLKDKISQTNNCWQKYQFTDFSERSKSMKNLAQILNNRKENLAKLMAAEMGKPIKQGFTEIDKCIWVCNYYAENASQILKDEIIETEASKSYISHRPLGVILAIMPWNFPFWQSFRFLAPALMAGNAAVLKHASNVSGCAIAIEEMVNEAGFPNDIFKTLLISSDKLNPVIENPLIKAVTLTGSVNAGKKVAELAGSLIKKAVLELGGSDAYIILEDADLDYAAETCASSRLINSGQSCIAAKRFIVVKSIEEEFTQLLKDKMNSRQMGNPLHESTDIGPQAREDLRNELHQQVLESIQKGATCILGGEILELKGAFYPATILTKVKKGMPAYDDELFGPVASIISAEDEEDAINLANDTIFGLGAAIFTSDVERGELLAKTRMQAGSCFVNSLVKSDPRLPFGGINQSGYGRELGSYGIKEFVNIKTVYVK